MERKDILYITYEKSLYGAIAYIWYILFMKNKGREFISVENAEAKELWGRNIEELQRFVDTIKYIK